MEIYSVSHPSQAVEGNIALTSSKSESNRALIIQALSQQQITLDNISAARDTQTMMRLLKSDDQTLDVLDAGTTMRFLTAFSTSKNRDTIMTGTERMQERPIKILVDALRSIGAEIEYLKNDGYPPFHIKSFEQSSEEVSVQGDISSQYISALLMIAPTLPKGLKIQLTGEVASRPYIEMTLQLMDMFGISYNWSDSNCISIAPQEYQENAYTIESDWSGASYWYSIVALAKEAKIKLLNLRDNSLQGDRAIVEIMEQLGVSSTFDNEGVVLQKIEAKESFDYDFTHCPDLAQTIAVVCAALGIEGRLRGLKSLRIKETDRIAAIETELQKMGIAVEVFGDDEIVVKSGTIQLDGARVDTYEDHRMAMAFAPLALLHSVEIEEPDVVQKSYPIFWDHLKQVGFEIK
ncbi:3-phosphoshikimate 1-carboxyvinyltransferase [Sediminitomix flava]|uniref:3-phosphoshikimate 1-carboxyvinyltransferase n=1 Tax=Sediminitomix flava TaxID=379075 RepID=A0A315ZH96_SEDFL|nr:3-phosphoshikimate 1-carboxyvinyltransferase [Sediminitomix flava]PWJ44956.1 3-phosphoshikimate 1-carboxyvinyltransferase [Sediminitomix flava]